MRKKKRGGQAKVKPVVPAPVVEKAVTPTPVAEEAVTPTPVVEEAAVDVPAPTAEEPVAVPVVEEPTAVPAMEESAPEASAAESEKKTGRRGRKPKAELAEKAPKRAQKAKDNEPKAAPARRTKVDVPEGLGLYVQYQGSEVDMAAIAETAKAEFKAATKKSRISSLKVYLKPEERVAYYVINDDFRGQVAI